MGCCVVTGGDGRAWRAQAVSLIASPVCWLPRALWAAFLTCPQESWQKVSYLSQSWTKRRPFCHLWAGFSCLHAQTSLVWAKQGGDIWAKGVLLVSPEGGRGAARSNPSAPCDAAPQRLLLLSTAPENCLTRVCPAAGRAAPALRSRMLGDARPVCQAVLLPSACALVRALARPWAAVSEAAVCESHRRLHGRRG